MEFLAIGTLWFWLAAIAWFIIVTFCIEKEESTGWGALLTSGAFMAALFFFGSREPVIGLLRYIADNPGTIIGAITLYLFLGISWSMMKWWFFLKGDRKRQWDSYLKYNNGAKDDTRFPWNPAIPKARDNKSTILMWMSWWPFTAIFDHLERTYDRMAERIMRSE